VAASRAGDAVRIVGHVMPSQDFGSASRRNLALIGASIVVRFLCITIACSLTLRAQSEVHGLVTILEVDGLAIGFDDFATNEPVIDAILPRSIGDSDLLHRDSMVPPGAMPAFSNGFRPAHSVGTARRFGPEK